MSTVDKALEGTEGSNALTAQDAFAAIALISIASDGELAPEENIAMAQALSRMKLYEGWSKEQYAALFKRITTVLRRIGMTGLLGEAAKSITPELKETAFAVASDLTLADGAVEETERTFLKHLQETLGIAEDRAAKIIEVMVIKNKG